MPVPSFVKGQRVVLRCDAVTHHARIYLNGELLVTHECGFLPFEVELTEKLQPGENLLTVAVSKRARTIQAQDKDKLVNGEKPISIACKEIYEGKQKIVREQNVKG